MDTLISITTCIFCCVLCFESSAAEITDLSNVESNKNSTIQSINNHDEILMERINKEIKDGRLNPHSLDDLSSIIDPIERRLARLKGLRADYHFENKKYNEAIIDYNDVKKFSKNGYIEFRIGRCLFEQTRYYESIKMFENARDSIPPGKDNDLRSLNSYYIMVSMMNMKDFINAEPLYRDLISKWPDNEDLKKMSEFFNKK